jgi:multidrug efflux pump subunit AcrB
MPPHSSVSAIIKFASSSKPAGALVAAANKDATFAGVFTLFNAGSPSVYAEIDRLKAEKVGLTPTDVFSTLQVYLGSQYVNDFNYLGRTYQVRVQGDGKFRRTELVSEI